MKALHALSILSVLALTGCAQSGPFLPTSGPDRASVLGNAALATGPTETTASLPYVLVPLTQPLVSLLQTKDQPPSFDQSAAEQPVSETLIGIGDTVVVTIFESGAGGLFIPPDAGSRSGNFVTLPGQQVDRQGNISIPYGGTIRAQGRTTIQVQRAIEARLANRALEPQVVVTLTDRQSSTVSVLGEVNKAERLPLDAGGERLLSAIARAGGPKYPSYESMVTVQRRGRVVHALLGEIAQNPSQNIALRPGDVVYISREPRYFTTLGAMGQTNSVEQINRRFPFDSVNLSMVDAVARAGGLTDDRANPRAVFLYRFEKRETLQAAGLAVPPNAPEDVPTVYLVDFLNPSVFFMASKFPIRDGDLIYTSNAPATELSKFLSLLSPGTGSIASVRSGLF
ncbi:polysaccharide biosynthesis/export family protein [Roseomonas elaeocarpi]|uniref:Polysaccharide biosynthesis/export family protein n=1 Tax=Roseomonas elaeocarpi TaxID=907779 RepID=A0ABV6JLP7_9PROT